MTSKCVSRPHISFIGNAATEVTGSMWLVRFQRYTILLDAGLTQGHDIATDYQRNRDMLRKVKPREVDYIILDEIHADHSCLIPALYAKGCSATLIVPKGSIGFLRLLWFDSMKIMQQGCIKLQKKSNIKASPFYTEEDIDIALNHIIEIENATYEIANNISVRFLESGHLIHAKQILLELRDGYKKIRIGFTGDIGGTVPQPYVEPREAMPFVDVLISENTYNTPGRPNKAYDRDKDMDKIETAIKQYDQVLFPVFALGRTQTILTVLHDLWKQGRIPQDIKVVVDSPLAIKFCKLYPDTPEWDAVHSWANISYVEAWDTSLALQQSGKPMVVLASSGFMQGGRILSWLKHILPNRNACICFCGFSGDCGTAHDIRYGEKVIEVDGEMIPNECNIVELVSFSSHANYQELLDYLADECRYNRVCLVHGNMEHKLDFTNVLQNRLIADGKSSRVICIQKDQKIYI